MTRENDETPSHNQLLQHSTQLLFHAFMHIVDKLTETIIKQ